MSYNIAAQFTLLSDVSIPDSCINCHLEQTQKLEMCEKKLVGIVHFRLRTIV